MNKVLSLLLIFCTACDYIDYQNSPKKLELMLDEEASRYYSIAKNSNNQFADNLLLYYLNQPEKNDKNIFFSPFSLFSALGMTTEGAQGETRAELQKMLHLEPTDSVRRKSFLALYSYLYRKITLANALWLQKDNEFDNDFLAVNNQYYAANTVSLDFKDNEKAAKKINDWAAKNTQNRIPKLVEASQFDKNTRLVLTNAIYFEGLWANEFGTHLTNKQVFKNSNGTENQVDMMHSESHHFYFEDKKIQILEIPYLGDDFCFTIILPKKNNTLLSYSSSELTTYLDKAKKTSLVELSLPKFKMEADYSVKNDLEALGIHTAFSPSANFEGIAKNQNLCIDEVIHKTFIEIDEVGTIAAAVTEVELSVAADADSFEQPKKVIFNVNHPFLFAIRHKITGTNLFLGVINQL